MIERQREFLIKIKMNENFNKIVDISNESLNKKYNYNEKIEDDNQKHEQEFLPFLTKLEKLKNLKRFKESFKKSKSKLADIKKEIENSFEKIENTKQKFEFIRILKSSKAYDDTIIKPINFPKK